MEKQLYTVLSVDGGGIRGIIPIRILAEMERRLGRPISDAVDLAAGTSTGAIIVGGLTSPHPAHPDQPRFKATDLEQFYLNDGPEIFRKTPFNGLKALFRPKFDNTALKESLEKFFGDIRLDHALTSVMMTAYDIERREAVFMRHLKDNPDGDNERRWKMRDAALASSSAPTYFKPVRIRSTSAKPGGSEKDPAVMEHTLIDGGIFVNNPAVAAYIAARKVLPKDADIFIMSLGTGNATRRFPYEKAKNWGSLEWINPQADTPIISAAMDGQTSGVDAHMEFILGDRYFRLDPPLRDLKDRKLSPSDSFDDASPANIKKLQHFADRIIKENSDTIDRMVDVLRTRMEQKDLARNAEKQPPSAELIEATKPKTRRGPMEWLSDFLTGKNKAGDANKFGWNAEQLDNARHHPATTTPVTPGQGQAPASMAEQMKESETLKALARRFGERAGMKPADIEEAIQDAVAASRDHKPADMPQPKAADKGKPGPAHGKLALIAPTQGEAESGAPAVVLSLDEIAAFRRRRGEQMPPPAGDAAPLPRASSGP
jgi:uncharacterized protein